MGKLSSWRFSISQFIPFWADIFFFELIFFVAYSFLHKYLWMSFLSFFFPPGFCIILILLWMISFKKDIIISSKLLLIIELLLNWGVICIGMLLFIQQPCWFLLIPQHHACIISWIFYINYHTIPKKNKNKKSEILFLLFS